MKTAHLHCALVDKRRLLRWEVAFLPFSDDHLASEQKHVSLLSSSLACVAVPQDHVILQSSKQQRLVTILWVKLVLNKEKKEKEYFFRQKSISFSFLISVKWWFSIFLWWNSLLHQQSKGAINPQWIFVWKHFSEEGNVFLFCKHWLVRLGGVVGGGGGSFSSCELRGSSSTTRQINKILSSHTQEKNHLLQTDNWKSVARRIRLSFFNGSQAKDQYTYRNGQTHSTGSNHSSKFLHVSHELLSAVGITGQILSFSHTNMDRQTDRQTKKKTMLAKSYMSDELPKAADITRQTLNVVQELRMLDLKLNGGQHADGPLQGCAVISSPCCVAQNVLQQCLVWHQARDGTLQQPGEGQLRVSNGTAVFLEGKKEGIIRSFKKLWVSYQKHGFYAIGYHPCIFTKLP